MFETECVGAIDIRRTLTTSTENQLPVASATMRSMSGPDASTTALAVKFLSSIAFSNATRPATMSSSSSPSSGSYVTVTSSKPSPFTFSAYADSVMSRTKRSYRSSTSASTRPIAISGGLGFCDSSARPARYSGESTAKPSPAMPRSDE